MIMAFTAKQEVHHLSIVSCFAIHIYPFVDKCLSGGTGQPCHNKLTTYNIPQLYY